MQKSNWYVWDMSSGNFLEGSFASKEEAEECIEECGEKGYLMKAVKMTETEHKGRWVLNYFFDTEEAKELDKKIQESDEKEWLYTQLIATGCLPSQLDWLGEQYAEHFAFVLLEYAEHFKRVFLEGGYASEDDFFYKVKLIPFKEFLGKLFKDIESVYYSDLYGEDEETDLYGEDEETDLYGEDEETEHEGRRLLNYFFDTEEAKELDKKIQESDEKEWLYNQLIATEFLPIQLDWLGDQYAGHFKFTLLEGGYASEEDFHEVKLISFREFLGKIIKDIESIYYSDLYGEGEETLC